MVYHVVKTNRSPLGRALVLVAGSLSMAAACGPGGAASPSPRDATRSAGKAADGGAATPRAEAPPPASKSVPRPNRRLTIPEARRYMLALVNRDRATQGLAPVELDEGPPTAAGQAHAEDMARLGYLGHWGSDGSVPEQRHTDAGGADMVLENALCFVDEKARRLDASPLVDPEQIERAEAQFFDEVPPNDGHRRNILKPHHTRVGIGIAQPLGTVTEIAVPCVAQEFTDGYGTYAPLPRRAKVGAVVHVEGTLSGNAKPTGVGLARVALPRPLPPAELNRRRSYPVPKPFQMYWVPGYVTPIPVKVEGTKLAIDVPLSDKSQPGLYEVSVWGKLHGGDEHTMLSVRTIVVE
jgi:uncharacterized protein YkwD